MKTKKLDEKLILSSGYKKKWFDDRSGFWFEKKIELLKSPVKGVKFVAVIERDERFFIDMDCSHDTYMVLSFKSFEKLEEYCKSLDK